MAKQADLLPVDVARDRILAGMQRLEEESVRLEDALGRVLAIDMAAQTDVPPFANSSMDGFALRSKDTIPATPEHPVVLPVSRVIAAGQPPGEPLPDGTCARIMTGAPLPPGADGVVPFEDVDDMGDSIAVSDPVAVGGCVRDRGQDTRAGETVLASGTLLGSAQIALLASVGYGEAPVIRRPVVTILSTGDELVSPGETLGPGQIYNSNTPMLRAAVLEAGGVPVVLPVSGDDEAGIEAAVAEGSRADLLLTSGGASVGDFDRIRAALTRAGDVGFWRVRMRPGKPLIFGRVNSTPVLGLPGNPTSAMVTFEQFARPAIRCMLGLPTMRPEIEGVLDQPMTNGGRRRTYARVRLQYREGAFHVIPSGPQDSAMLVPLAHADGLMEMHEDCESLAAGDTVRVQVWRLPSLE